MPIHFGWYGTRGKGGFVHEDFVAMQNTAIDVVVSYGFGPTKCDFKTKVEKFIKNTIGFTGIKLIPEFLPKALDDVREGDNSALNCIYDHFKDNSGIWGYLIEEPNFWCHNWPSNTIDIVRNKFNLTNQDIVVDVRPAGGRDPSKPTKKPHESADQSTVNGLANVADVISSFWYPNPGRNWSKINGIAAVPSLSNPAPQVLYYLSNHTGSAPFWYTVDVKANTNVAESSKAIIKWQVHMAIVKGAEGILFYSYYFASTTARNDVKCICKEIKNCVVHDAFATESLPSKVQKLDGNNVVYAFREYCGDFWLLVVDGSPKDNTGNPINFTFKCNLGRGYKNFQYIRDMYNAPTTNVSPVLDPGGNWKQFSGTLTQGQVRMYRIFIGASC